MDKVDHVSPLVELEVEEVIEDVGLDQEAEEDIEDLRFEIEEDIEEDLVQEEGEEEEKDSYKDFMLYPQVTSFKHDTGESVHGIQVTDLPLSTDHKRYEFDLCPICLKPWTLDKIHQMSCLPCGHMFGMSCLKKWIKDRPSDKCPHCYQNFSLESVRLLYAPRLCIPATADQKMVSFCQKGFTTFKHYEWQLRTNALNKRSDVLKQRAVVLGRQNDAMKRRTELMNRMDDVEKRADVLERHNNAMKWQTQLLNRMTDEEDWAEASQQQADAEKRAEVFRRKAGALGQCADEYLRKADAFGQQAKALCYQQI
ncbi:zinc finger, RING/FYVE/PHD-type containing protein [Tanacetum coccineum]